MLQTVVCLKKGTSWAVLADLVVYLECFFNIMAHVDYVDRLHHIHGDLVKEPINTAIK